MQNLLCIPHPRGQTGLMKTGIVRQRVREQKKKGDSLVSTTNTVITTAHTDVGCLLDTETAPICKLCKTIGDPCPFEIKPAQPASHLDSKDWTKEEEKIAKENEVPNDYYSSSPVYDPYIQTIPPPHCTPKQKMALDPNYYTPGYIPEEQEKDDAPLLVTNLVDPLGKNTPEDPVEEEEDYYLDYSDSNHIHKNNNIKNKYITL